MAARLLREELWRGWSVLAVLDAADLPSEIPDDVVDSELLMWKELRDLPLWKEHRAVLARKLDHTAWEKVTSAFMAVEAGFPRPGQGWQERLGDGFEALNAVAGVPQPPRKPPDA